MFSMEVAELIKNQKPIRFINDCSALVDYEQLSKATIWYAKSPVASVKHIYLHGEYPAISVKKRKYIFIDCL